jgi:hypothetical protein
MLVANFQTFLLIASLLSRVAQCYQRLLFVKNPRSNAMNNQRSFLSHLSQQSRFVEGIDFIIEDGDSDNTDDEQGQLSEEEELTNLAASEAKLFTLAVKSDLTAPVKQQQFKELIENDGVVRIDNVIPQELASRLAALVTVELEQSINFRACFHRATDGTSSCL